MPSPRIELGSPRPQRGVLAIILGRLNEDITKYALDAQKSDIDSEAFERKIYF